jgi:hypothetical protein
MSKPLTFWWGSLTARPGGEFSGGVLQADKPFDDLPLMSLRSAERKCPPEFSDRRAVT